VEALLPILGADRIGVRLSPLGKMNDISDDNPESTFGYIAERPSDFRMAYLHIVNPALEQMQRGEKPEPGALNMVRLIRNKYQGTLIVAGGFDAESAAHWLREGLGDLIAFGRKFIANPRFARAAAHRRTVERRRSNYLLRWRREGIHGLSLAGTGPRQQAKSLCRSALEVTLRAGATP
jgi:2,4-dienoyl-CoA reductase-like NADH-dependent reductase (Old Yellow Enzyme family)